MLAPEVCAKVRLGDPAAIPFATLSLCMLVARLLPLGLSLLVIGGPEAAFWARQVMLDIPAYAAVVTGFFFFVRYLRGGSRPIFILESLRFSLRFTSKSMRFSSFRSSRSSYWRSKGGKPSTAIMSQQEFSAS